MIRTPFKVLLGIVIVAYLAVVVSLFTDIFHYISNTKVDVKVLSIEEAYGSYDSTPKRVVLKAEDKLYAIENASGSTYYNLFKDVTIAVDENGTVYEPIIAYLFNPVTVLMLLSVLVPPVYYGGRYIVRRHK